MRNGISLIKLKFMFENQVICQIYINEATQHNAIRIGFSTYIEDEIVLLIGKLKKTMKQLEKMR